MNPLPDLPDIIGGLLRPVRDADTAGQIDERKMNAELLMCLCGKLEQLSGKLRVILIGNGVGGKECMNPEVLHAVSLQLRICIEKLLLRHAVLGIPGIVHDAIAHLENSARIEAAAHCLRKRIAK